jgi:hypothetical protein
MSEASEITEVVMHASQTYDGAYVPGARVSLRKNPVAGMNDNIALDENGDCEIVERTPHPTLPDWLRFTIRPIH